MNDLPIPERVEDLYTWELGSLYKLYFQLTNDRNSYKFLKVHNGIHVRIPIYKITHNWYDIFPHKDTVKIYGMGHCPLELFMQDIDERRKLIVDEVSQIIKDKPSFDRTEEVQIQ